MHNYANIKHYHVLHLVRLCYMFNNDILQFCIQPGNGIQRIQKRMYLALPSEEILTNCYCNAGDSPHHLRYTDRSIVSWHQCATIQHADK